MPLSGFEPVTQWSVVQCIAYPWSERSPVKKNYRCWRILIAEEHVLLTNDKFVLENIYLFILLWEPSYYRPQLPAVKSGGYSDPPPPPFKYINLTWKVMEKNCGQGKVREFYFPAKSQVIFLKYWMPYNLAVILSDYENIWWGDHSECAHSLKEIDFYSFQLLPLAAIKIIQIAVVLVISDYHWDDFVNMRTCNIPVDLQSVVDKMVREIRQKSGKSPGTFFSNVWWETCTWSSPLTICIINKMSV